MTTSATARQLAQSAFQVVFLREPTLAERQAAQAVALHESGYGDGWDPPGNGSNNQGAITAGASWKGETFQYGDSKPTQSGQVQYVTKFRKYPSPEAGWQDLMKVLYKQRPAVLEAATRGDLHGVAVAMRESSYYLGVGKTKEAQIAGYEKALREALDSIQSKLGEADAFDSPPSTTNATTEGPWQHGNHGLMILALVLAAGGAVYAHRKLRR